MVRKMEKESSQPEHRLTFTLFCIQFFLHCLACPGDGGLDTEIGVRMKGWNKNAEAGSGETWCERRSQSTSMFCLCCCCIHLLMPNKTNLKVVFKDCKQKG
ncbi:hypothetical protein JOB18_047185 [Solea senegalensis]|uniref:Secreted protein n=1 Tax=Solea senegalensis TaxID=28829 RepID=A0AAV6RQQ0_SOLSE|nr:hypothetical protein JOB18_047185 [Solea senegalensis]